MSSDRWTRLDLPALALTIAAEGRHVALGLADGRLLRSADGGTTWTASATGATARTMALLPLSEAVLVGTASGVARVHATEGWRPGLGIPLSATVTALAARGGGAIAGTRRAGVYRSADGGVRWVPAEEGLPRGSGRLHIHAAVAGPHGLVVAHALGVSRSRDGGRTWISADIGLPFQLPHLGLAADESALYVGVGGRLYRAMEPPAEPVLAWMEAYDGPGLGRPLDLLGSAGGVLYAAVTDPPYLLCSADGGGTWGGVGTGIAAPPVAVALAASGLLAVLPDGTLWRTARPPWHPPPTASLRLDVRGTVAADEVHLTFALDAPATVALTVCDVLDREVACPLRGEVGAGVHHARLPARSLDPGLYRCRLLAGGRSAAAVLVLH